MKLQSKAFLFLVGCPRSGTTLLQSILASHSQIHSFPETHFFDYLKPRSPLRKMYYLRPELMPKYEPLRTSFGLVSRKLRPKLEHFFKEEINRPELLSSLPKSPLSLFPNYNARKFMEILDLLTQEQGKNIVLEKTPEHILSIDYIEKIIPQVKFIHLVREGSDVIASLYEATSKYPDYWGEEPWTIDNCIYRWNQSVAITLQYISKPNHFAVRYEEILKSPHKTLVNLCQFIGVSFEEKMLQDYSFAAKQMQLEKAGRLVETQGIRSNRTSKFQQLFNDKQKEYILKRILKLDFEKFI